MGSTDDPSVLPRRSTRKRVLRWLAVVAIVPAVACCVLGVIVGLRDGWAYTVDGLILESIGCVVAAVALPILIGGSDG